MAKANLVLPDGGKVTIEGTTEEVATLLERFSSTGGKARKASRDRPRTARERKGGSAKPTSGPTEYIRELKQAGFFKTKRDIGEVRDKLEEGAHIYQVTSLSAPLYRLVKKRELRRIKEDGAWKYVNP